MAQRVKYDAFISYRHKNPDSEIAEKLHKKLEYFRLPKDVAKKVGITRLRRVFRDEAELAVSDDLSESIETALRNSKYLICICSPEYLESPWCKMEIEGFLKYNDRKHVLLVLAKGEPETAFPEILLYDEVFEEDDEGREFMVRKPREPLAADCRAKDTRERNQAVNDAVLRIAAAMVGIGYDDLKKRHHRAQNAKRTRRTLIAFAILAAVIGICAFFLLKLSGQNAKIIKQNEEISKQNEEIQARYADSLAAISDNLLRDGRKKDAIYAARQALSETKGANYSDAATRALTNALGIYDNPDKLNPEGDIRVPCTVGSFKVSSMANHILVRSLEEVEYVVDVRTGEVVLSFTPAIYGDTEFDGENGLIYVCNEENYKYYNFITGKSTDLGVAEGSIYTDPAGNGYAICTDEEIRLFRGENLLMSIAYYSLEAFPYGSSFDSSYYFSADGGSAFMIMYFYDSARTYFYKADLLSQTVVRKELATDTLAYNAMTDGNSVGWVVNDIASHTVYIQSVDNPNDVRSYEYHEEIWNIVISGSDVVVYGPDHIYYLNRYLQQIGDGIDVNTFVSEHRVTDDGIILFEERGTLFHKFRAGEHTVFESPSPSAQSALWEKDYRNGKVYMTGIGDNHIYTFAFRESEYMTEYIGDYDPLLKPDYDDPDVAKFKSMLLANETDISNDGIYAAFPFRNANLWLVQFWDGKAVIYDGTTLQKVKSIFTEDGFIDCAYYDAERECYYIGSDKLSVYDTDFKEFYEIKDARLLGINTATGNPVILTLNAEEEKKYEIHPVQYSDLISMADAELGDFEPDDRVKEKYGLE